MLGFRKRGEVPWINGKSWGLLITCITACIWVDVKTEWKIKQICHAQKAIKAKKKKKKNKKTQHPLSVFWNGAVMRSWLCPSVPRCRCECVWIVCVKWCFTVPVLRFLWAHPVNKQFTGWYVVVAMQTASVTCPSSELPTRGVCVACVL